MYFYNEEEKKLTIIGQDEIEKKEYLEVFKYGHRVEHLRFQAVNCLNGNMINYYGNFPDLKEISMDNYMRWFDLGAITAVSKRLKKISFGEGYNHNIEMFGTIGHWNNEFSNEVWLECLRYRPNEFMNLQTEKFDDQEFIKEAAYAVIDGMKHRALKLEPSMLTAKVEEDKALLDDINNRIQEERLKREKRKSNPLYSVYDYYKIKDKKEERVK